MLTENEVFERLADAGIKIPRTRFENWRERGLLPPTDPRTSRGKARGRAAILYPEITVDQVKQIVELRRQNLDLDEIGWRLWLEGYDVARRLWFDVFEAEAEEFDSAASEVRKALDSDDLDKSPIEELAKEAVSAKTSYPLFRQVRKALGPDRLPAIVLHVASMAIGDFTSISTPRDRMDTDATWASIQRDPMSRERQDDLRAMDVALGLGRARTDTVDGVGPIIEGDYSPILRETFAPLAETTLAEFLASVDPECLRKTTRDLSAFTRSLAAATQEFDRTLAKDAFGFRRAALLSRSERMQQARSGLMWSLILEKSTHKFHDLGAMAQLFDAAAKSASNLPQSDKLAENPRRPNFRRGSLKKLIK